MAEKKLELQEKARPQTEPGREEIRIELCGICGSDMSGFLGHSSRRKPPLILGHELVGFLRNGKRVVANLLTSCGECPACLSGAQDLCARWRLLGMDETQGSFAEYVSLPEKQIHEVERCSLFCASSSSVAFRMFRDALCLAEKSCVPH